MSNRNSENRNLWRAVLVKHHQQKRIAVYFERTPELVDRIKKLNGVRWSNTLKVWHLPDTLENRERFKIETEDNKLSDKKEDIDKFIFWLRSKRYSESTIKTYVNALRSFLLFNKQKSISEINNEE